MFYIYLPLDTYSRLVTSRVTDGRRNTALMILLLLLLKKASSARLRESDIHPISPKTPAAQYQPIDRNKRKGKRVEDYSRDRVA